MRRHIRSSNMRSAGLYTAKQTLVSIVGGDDKPTTADAGATCHTIVSDHLTSAQRGWFHPAFNQKFIRGCGDDGVRCISGVGKIDRQRTAGVGCSRGGDVTRVLSRA